MLIINNSANPHQVVVLASTPNNTLGPNDVVVALTNLKSAKIPPVGSQAVTVTDTTTPPVLPAAGPPPGDAPFPFVTDSVSVTPNVFIAHSLNHLGDAQQAFALAMLGSALTADPARPWVNSYSMQLGVVAGAFEWWYYVVMDDGTHGIMFGGTWDPMLNKPNPPPAAVGTYRHPGLKATWTNGTDGTGSTNGSWVVPNLPAPPGFVYLAPETGPSPSPGPVSVVPSTLAAIGASVLRAFAPAAATTPSTPFTLWNPLSITTLILAIVFFVAFVTCAVLMAKKPQARKL